MLEGISSIFTVHMLLRLFQRGAFSILRVGLTFLRNKTIRVLQGILSDESNSMMDGQRRSLRRSSVWTFCHSFVLYSYLHRRVPKDAAERIIPESVRVTRNLDSTNIANPKFILQIATHHTRNGVRNIIKKTYTQHCPNPQVHD